MQKTSSWPIYQRAASLDPLQFDGLATAIPEANLHNPADLQSIAGESFDAAEQALKEGIGQEDAVAILRDLDFVVGSLLRHDIWRPELRFYGTLRALGSIAGTVPRGTVYTYAGANPSGERERSFTGTDTERFFISAVRDGLDALEPIPGLLAGVSTTSIEGITEADEGLKRMAGAMVGVSRNVTPEFFSGEMRPYFDELSIDGNTYTGAGGAQMQVIAIDRMLWGIDCGDPDYQAYYAENVRYLPQHHRQQLADFSRAHGHRSIVSRLCGGELPPEAVPPTTQLLRTLRRFRYPHKRVADANFALRTEGSVGSGQYTPEILAKLISLNNAAMDTLKACIK